MERILVTGGAGYVGSACCAQLLKQGYSVDIIDNFSTGHCEAPPEQATVHECDYGDSKTLSGLLETKHFDAVFHFAAKALIPESVTNPGAFFDSNVASGIIMLETLRKYNINKFIFSSAAAVYGSPSTVPIPEEHTKNPTNSYGESKLVFEQILKWYASAYGWSVVAFRYFNACGGAMNWGERHDPETHIIPLLLQTASGRRDHFDIYGTDYPTPDGTCLRDYVHVTDIAAAHILALQKVRFSGFYAYNIGTGTSYSVKQVCESVEKVTGTKLRVRAAERRPGDPAVLCANPKKLMDEFGWRPEHSSLDEIIAGAWQWEQTACQQSVAQAA